MVTIDFYNYTGKDNTINKVLADPVVLTGLFRDSVNILQPVIRVRSNKVFNFNYCYIHEVNRYYHVVNFVVVDKDTYEIRLRIDVLKTYADEILSATGTVIEKQDADSFISVGRNIVDVRPNIERMDFPETDLFDSDGHIIMVTLNGKID